MPKGTGFMEHERLPIGLKDYSQFLDMGFQKRERIGKALGDPMGSFCPCLLFDADPGVVLYHGPTPGACDENGHHFLPLEFREGS